MKKVLAHYLVLLSATTIVEALKRTKVEINNAPNVAKPLTVLQYLAESTPTGVIVKKNADLINDFKAQLATAMDSDELAKQDVINLLEDIAEHAEVIAAEAADVPKQKRAARKPKAEIAEENPTGA